MSVLHSPLAWCVRNPSRYYLRLSPFPSLSCCPFGGSEPLTWSVRHSTPQPQLLRGSNAKAHLPKFNIAGTGRARLGKHAEVRRDVYPPQRPNQRESPPCHFAAPDLIRGL